MAAVVDHGYGHFPLVGVGLGTGGGEDAGDFAQVEHGFGMHGFPRKWVRFM
ncbi:hypothetical protein D3C78_1975240 [compost metagenome]